MIRPLIDRASLRFSFFFSSSSMLAAMVVAGGSALGCSSPDPAMPPPPAEDKLPMPEGGLLDYPVDAVGPFNVGYRTWVHTYSPKGIDGPRDIRINVWYPTLDKTGDPPHYIGLFIDGDVIEDASLAPPLDPAGYPVHVYSHGYSGFGGTSAEIMHYYASHGWVAIAPDHTGNTLPENADSVPLTMHFLRSFDISESLNVLEALPADDPLAGKCRTDSVLLSGHSFGSETAWGTGGATYNVDYIQAKCDEGTSFSEPCTPEQIAVFNDSLGDPRVTAAIPMAGGAGSDPGWFGLTGYDAVKKPYMLLTGTDDPVGAQNVWDRVMTIDFTWIDFEGGCHQLFALGGCKNLSDEEGFPLVNTYTFAFGQHHILGDTSARVMGILDGSEVLSPKAHFQRKNK